MPSNLSIMVVDDNPDVLALFREVLSIFGHRVRTFDDGATAVADFRRRPTDLVITDLGMPDVTGWQVARLVRETSAATPIVFITAVGEQVDETLAQGLRIAAVLRKPFKISEITAVLQGIA